MEISEIWKYSSTFFKKNHDANQCYIVIHIYLFSNVHLYHNTVHNIHENYNL